MENCRFVKCVLAFGMENRFFNLRENVQPACISGWHENLLDRDGWVLTTEKSGII